MNVKTFATYTVVFVAGAAALLGLNALSGNQNPSAEPAENTTSAATTSVADKPLSTPPAMEEPADNAEADHSQGPVATSEGFTAIGDLARNTFVTVQGTVERVTDEDEFLIADESGSVRVWTANSFFTVEPGEVVIVQGFVDDDVFIEIYAQEITRADGTVVTIGSYSG